MHLFKEKQAMYLGMTQLQPCHLCRVNLVLEVNLANFQHLNDPHKMDITTLEMNQHATAASLLKIAAPITLGGEGRPWQEFIAAFQTRLSETLDLGDMMQLASQAWAMKALLNHGSADQIDHWIPQLLQGGLAATALAEPQSGTDIAQLQTVLTPDTKGWMLSGHKRNISHAAEASLIICLAQETDSSAYRLVLLDRSRHPWQAQPSPPKIGLSMLPTAELTLADVQIGRGDLLAHDKNALATLADFMTFGRGLIALGIASILKRHLQDLLTYTQTRTSGGRPIAAQQYMQRKLTDAQLGITQTRLLADATLQAHLAGAPDALALGNMAKITASKALLTCSQDFLSILGTTGFQDGPIAHLAIDALAFQAIGGTEETHRMQLFKQMQRGML
jgi:alkylation response protein AidB-like acyl-CoA dehydrogenase